MRKLLVGLLLLTACAKANVSKESSGGRTASADTGGGTGGGGGGGQAGVLTAGAWDDNLNFDFYQGYLSSQAVSALPGLPQAFRHDRLVVHVTDAQGQPLPGAQLTADLGGRSFTAPVPADGVVYLFPTWQGVQPGSTLSLSASAGGQAGQATAHAGDAEVTLSVAAPAQAPQAVEVAFVVDTTGSMGDELSFLSAEIEAISAAVSARFPGVAQRYALVVYRDDSDEYVVRSFDFTSDLAAFKGTLQAQSAGGGGDYEEAPEQGLAAAGQLHWSGGSTARLLFHVADAPHHAGREGLILDAVARARELGVRIYPVAASGADERTEFTMRSEAELTGGRYLFLTDDSGVGGAHLEPTLPCYQVTHLDQALLRMISMELTGKRLSPEPGEVLRTGGDPHDGACTLQGGIVVQVL